MQGGIGQTFENGAWAQVAFDNELADTDANMANTDTDTDAITIRTAGTYLLHARMIWNENAGGARSIDLRVDGVQHALDRRQAANAGATAQTVTAIVRLNAGQVATMHAGQTSGGPVGTWANYPSSPVLSATRVG